LTYSLAVWAYVPVWGARLGGGGHEQVALEADVAGRIGNASPRYAGKPPHRLDEGRAQRPHLAHHARDARELGERHGGGELAHATITPDEHWLLGGRALRVLGPVLTKVGHAGRPLVEAGGRGQDHAALAGGDDLALLKAQVRNVRDRAGVAAPVGRSDALGVVLENPEAVLLRRLHDRGEVARNALVVHHQDALGAGRDAPGDLPGIKIQGLVDFGQHRLRAHAHDRGEAGNPAPDRQDYLVSGSDAEGAERDLERGGAAARAECIAHAEHALCEALGARGEAVFIRRIADAVVAEEGTALDHLGEVAELSGADEAFTEAHGRKATHGGLAGGASHNGGKVKGTA